MASKAHIAALADRTVMQEKTNADHDRTKDHLNAKDVAPLRGLSVRFSP